MNDSKNILFSFTRGDIKPLAYDPKNIVFDFTDKTIACSIAWKPVDGNKVNFDCVTCTPLSNSNDFVINCTDDNNAEFIELGIFDGYFGYESNTKFSIDISSISYYGHSLAYKFSNYHLLNNPIYYDGYSSTFEMLVYSMFYSADLEYGTETTYNLTRYPIFHDSQDITYGYELISDIAYNPFNPISETPIDDGVYGYELISNVAYNPFNPISETPIDDGYYGYELISDIAYNPFNPISLEPIDDGVYGYTLNNNLLFDTYNPIESFTDGYFGYELISDVAYNPFNPISLDPIDDGVYGYVLTNNLLFDTYNPFDSDSNGYYGNALIGDVSYNQLNPISLNPIDYGVYGYTLNNNLLFDTYNPLSLEPIDYGVYGYTLNNNLLFDKLNPFGEPISQYFGYTLNNPLLFDTYNPIEAFADGYYGNSAHAVVFYDDDRRITTDDIIFEHDIKVISDIKYADERLNAATRYEHGFESEFELVVPIGFKVTLGYGFSARAEKLMQRQPVVFFGANMRYGVNVLCNQWKPRVIDLQFNKCCDVKPFQLRHIQLESVENLWTKYGIDKGIAYTIDVSFQTQPRFNSKGEYGLDIAIVDNSVYFDAHGTYGLKANTRKVSGDINIDLGIGNFLIDQNNIKIELGKKPDLNISGYGIPFGFESRFKLCIDHPFDIITLDLGFESKFDLYVVEALRGRMYYNLGFSWRLNNNPKFVSHSGYGYQVTSDLYEEPFRLHYGFSAHVTSLNTDNYVEFLEEHELNNEYIFQNENGDPDLDRPNGYTLEGYPFTKYVKGRCF